MFKTSELWEEHIKAPWNMEIYYRLEEVIEREKDDRTERKAKYERINAEES